MVNELQIELITAEAKRLSDKYNKDFLECEDIMKITGIGRDNVRNLMRSKDFPTTRIGKRIVISVFNFARWTIAQSEVYNAKD